MAWYNMPECSAILEGAIGDIEIENENILAWQTQTFATRSIDVLRNKGRGASRIPALCQLN
jgi:hypothetical protein